MPGWIAFTEAELRFSLAAPPETRVEKVSKGNLTVTSEEKKTGVGNETPQPIATKEEA